MKALIRLLLQEQPDLGLHFLLNPFFSVVFKITVQACRIIGPAQEILVLIE